jgi:hypothetical protein
MCNHCSKDPRDAISEAELALQGLRLMVSQMAPNDNLSVDGTGALLGLIHDRLSPATVALQDYVPRSFPMHER